MPFFLERRAVYSVCRRAARNLFAFVLRQGQVASAVLLDSDTITGNEIHMCAKKYGSVARVDVMV